MEQIHKDRLLQLADFLEKLPPERFDYCTWGYENPKCGTVACAFGWAPEVFPELLSWTKTQVDDSFYYGFAVKGRDGNWRATHEEDAGKVIFGMDYEQFDYLFMPDNGPNQLSESATAQEVAAHIREFVTELNCEVPDW